MAGVTGLEPAASGVTGQRSNRLSYTPATNGEQVIMRPGPVNPQPPAGTLVLDARPAYVVADAGVAQR